MFCKCKLITTVEQLILNIIYNIIIISCVINTVVIILFSKINKYYDELPSLKIYFTKQLYLHF